MDVVGADRTAGETAAVVETDEKLCLNRDFDGSLDALVAAYKDWDAAAVNGIVRTSFEENLSVRPIAEIVRAF